MELQWLIENADIEYVRCFVASYADDPFVKLRRQRNLGEPRPTISKETVWMAMVGCLLTTQQRSSPGTSVNNFLSLSPFPLSYHASRGQADFESYARRTLSEFRGIRRWPTIAGQVKTNLNRLEGGMWNQVLEIVTDLNTAHEPPAERRAAHFVDEAFVGLGPKQSRNFLQWLGVSKYEIPIDSRITKWLNKHLLSFKLSAQLLADRTYYDMLSDGIQALCDKAGIYPCIFDAAVFTSFDKGAWRDDNLASDSLQGA